MKAFLMYRDRDFDPRQMLSWRESQRYARGVDQTLNLGQLQCWNAKGLTQDLGLDLLFGAMSLGDEFLFEAAKVAILSSNANLDTILYRQNVLKDCLVNAQVVRQLYRIAVEAIEAERKNHWSFLSRYPTGILHRAIDVLQMFVGALKNLRNIAEQHADKFESEGFCRFFAMLKQELSREYFGEIEDHLRRLRFRDGTLVSAELGKGNKGRDYVLCKPHEDARGWFTRLFAEKPESYTFQLHPRDEAGAQALSTLNDRGVNLVADALVQSTDHILNFLKMLRTELTFYLGCLNLHTQLAELKEPVCFPVPVPAGDRRLSFLGLYDVSLALSLKHEIVGNDLDADGRDLVIITGANTGGKSTFLRSLGIAQLMMQAGMVVPAEFFSSELCEGLFTHYKRGEDPTMRSGKLDEELGRMSAIVDRIKPNSLLLCNESFASTNEREGAEIARQIIQALLHRGVRIFFVTHLYHFAHSFFAQKTSKATFLRAERHPDGTRPFKLIEGEPLQTSHGEDLYRGIFAETGEG